MSGDDGARALLDVAGRLWPHATVRADRDQGADGQVYALVPSARRARMLVPLSPPAAAASSMCRFSDASTVRDVALRLGVAAAARATRGGALRHRVRVDHGPAVERGSLRLHLAEVLGREVWFSLGVGSARVNRKPVLQVFDARGTTLAFAKLGDSVQARRDVAGEATALRALEGRSLAPLVVPRVLGLSEWGDVMVLLITPLPTRPRWRRGATRTPVAAMDVLAGAFASPRSRLRDSPWWHRQRAAVARLADGDVARRLRRVVEVLADRRGYDVVEHGAWHGDWTPWNTATHRSAVLLWDWERFEADVPRGLDHRHFAVNAATRRHGIGAAVVLRALDGAGAPDDPASELTTELYLLAICVRYAALATAERGADIVAAASTMTRALETRLRLG